MASGKRKRDRKLGFLRSAVAVAVASDSSFQREAEKSVATFYS
ncbi:hypothetical protein CCACVL1_11983 [Corchorus capsularis]|uniref:Uncharacterized protein n=1 Tax=Corchorus capsularis TaxID=210143 RepID=A0A1R3IID8_COCAP|nr:hypothetical protein CCACVL1_11983 [Corchorus capsularis]